MYRSKWVRKINHWKLFEYILLSEIDLIKNKVEETTGVDLNRDGRVGGGGLTGAAETATHVDLNRDGVIGGKPATGSGG